MAFEGIKEKVFGRFFESNSEPKPKYNAEEKYLQGVGSPLRPARPVLEDIKPFQEIEQKRQTSLAGLHHDLSQVVIENFDPQRNDPQIRRENLNKHNVSRQDNRGK